MDNLEALIAALPPAIVAALRQVGRTGDLIEIVMDLGRPPEARYVNGEVMLSTKEIDRGEIDFVVERIGHFGDDNRAGIERTLHRISAIRNRERQVVGLTCRVGRAVYGTIDIIRDIVESGRSVLLLGRPGVGKTTMLREVARVLGEKKRVVIVDTSNEIGGDGDIPHPAVGRARRMQVATPIMQHAVMIEAVENHMPQTVVIDEIGNDLEAAAARTIAERGVQLVGTAHGNTLDNILMNPTLADLVGGIQTVTLSDEEARRRGTQKSVLERKAPPTFQVVVEIQERDRVAVHQDVADAVDALLRGRPIPPEIRYRDAAGRLHIERAELPRPAARPGPARGAREARREAPAREARREMPAWEEEAAPAGRPLVTQPQAAPAVGLRTLHVFPYGLNQGRLRQAAKQLNVPVTIADDIGSADVVFTLRSYYRKRPQLIGDAERRGLPVYVLRSNTVGQIQAYLADIFGLQVEQQDPYQAAMRETEEAIDRILSGTSSSVELNPQGAYVRRQQHEMARQANLISRSSGREPHRRVRILMNDRT
ncbi:MAG TPA: R3H domain-containing nucleic acid-binding protein [Anaerolineae bacterium]|nr:R3H domain-containing nucleic acid-binding protein [Anaerolineae bacterium]